MIGSLAIGSGKGGNVTVSARESVSISGRNDQDVSHSIVSFAAGDLGSISLSAPTVTLDGGAIGTPSLASGAFVGGQAGNISVKANNLTLRGGGGIASATVTDGDEGSITVETGRMTVSGGAVISAASGFRDPAMGTIVAGRGVAGNVVVTATESVSFSGQNSGLTSETLGRGNGGRISISTPVLNLDDRASISTDTVGALPGAGPGGDIQVQVGTASLASGARVSSSTRGSGHGGALSVMATDAISITGGQSRRSDRAVQ